MLCAGTHASELRAAHCSEKDFDSFCTPTEADGGGQAGGGVLQAVAHVLAVVCAVLLCGAGFDLSRQTRRQPKSAPPSEPMSELAKVGVLMVEGRLVDDDDDDDEAPLLAAAAPAPAS